MRKTFSLLALAVVAGFMTTGCANTEKKLGRGISNMFEIVRRGETGRAMEQDGLFYSEGQTYATGFIQGFSKSMARTGVGVYEIVTCPFPPYDPVCTSYLTPMPARPDNDQASLMEDSLYATDTNLGFSGGDIAPMIPGSKFRIFDTH